MESSDTAIISNKLDGIIGKLEFWGKRIFGYSARRSQGALCFYSDPPDRSMKDHKLSKTSRGERIEHYETIVRKTANKSMSPLHLYSQDAAWAKLSVSQNCCMTS